MDIKKLIETLKTDIKKWNLDTLKEAYNFCVDHMQEADQDTETYAHWYEIRECIKEQLEVKKHDL